MAERKLVVDQLKLTYEGVFELDGLYRTIDAWLYEKGYDKYEKKNYEQVLPTGKDIEIELMPWKKTTDYFKNLLRIRIRMTGVKDKPIKKQGVDLTVQQGRIMMIFDAYLESDYEHRWDTKPMFFFLRTVFDKYIFKSYFAKAEKWLVNDLNQLHERVQRFLNVYRYEKHI
ncbi:hypothetical protein GOV06_03525 [Candidatus Woesearchaeota archaeon]|nr:hypothetical protein [Candidatus Woesearchaeota archaeon]